MNTRKFIGIILMALSVVVVVATLIRMLMAGHLTFYHWRHWAYQVIVLAINAAVTFCPELRNASWVRILTLDFPSSSIEREAWVNDSGNYRYLLCGIVALWLTMLLMGSIFADLSCSNFWDIVVSCTVCSTPLVVVAVIWISINLFKPYFPKKNSH